MPIKPKTLAVNDGGSKKPAEEQIRFKGITPDKSDKDTQTGSFKPSYSSLQTEQQTTAPKNAVSPAQTRTPTGTGAQPAAAQAAPAAPTAQQDPTTNQSAPAATPTEQAPSTEAYEKAMAHLREMEKSRPSYESAYDADIADVYAQITGRGNFSYDLSEDALWQMYQEDYTRMGRRAMQDTMGKAAGLTGGYGSSYGQAVGQEAYDRYIEEMMDIAPELEERAYQRWTQEGDRLEDQLEYLREREAEDYARYLDEDKRWQADRDFAADQAAAEYSKWLTERSYADSREAQAHERENEERTRLESLIAIGYKPTDQELQRAGMSKAQYDTIAAQFAPAEPAKTVVYAAKKQTGTDPAKETDEQLEYLQYLKDQGFTPGSQVYQTAMRQLGYTKDPLTSATRNAGTSLGGQGGR